MILADALGLSEGPPLTIDLEFSSNDLEFYVDPTAPIDITARKIILSGNNHRGSLSVKGASANSVEIGTTGASPAEGAGHSVDVQAYSDTATPPVNKISTAVKINPGNEAKNNGLYLTSGIIMPSASATVPAGWLECNGQNVNEVDYPSLFASIGTLHGSSNPGTTFAIPDLRGKFIRGFSNGAANDPDKAARTFVTGASHAGGDNVGSIQDFATEDHIHTTTSSNTSSTSSGSFQKGTSVNAAVAGGYNTGAITGSAKTSTETRPLNVYLMYIIKT
jgi:microcystin-dependent protein